MAQREKTGLELKIVSPGGLMGRPAAQTSKRRKTKIEGVEEEKI